MPWEVLHTSLDLLLSSSCRPVSVEFSGGEPLLAFPLIQRAVRHMEKSAPGSQVEYLITTNGTLLDAGMLAFLDRHRFEVRLSFHTAPRTRDARERATFQRLDRLLDQIRGGYPAMWRERFTVAVTIGIREIPVLADTIAYLVEKGVRDIGVAAACGQPGWQARDLHGIERQFQRISALMRRRWAATGIVPLSLFRKEGLDAHRAKPVPVVCNGAAGIAIAVAPTGQANGCAMLAGARPVRAVAPAPAVTSAVPPPALVLPASSPLWQFDLGDVRDPAFARRLARYPSAVRRSQLFAQRTAHRSTDAQVRVVPVHPRVLGVPGVSSLRHRRRRPGAGVRFRVRLQPRVARAPRALPRAADEAGAPGWARARSHARPRTAGVLPANNGPMTGGTPVLTGPSRLERAAGRRA